MSIAFACECGKKLQAKDEYAGKRMRCPQCHEVVSIPSQASARRPAVASGKPAAKAPARPAAKIPPKQPPTPAKAVVLERPPLARPVTRALAPKKGARADPVLEELTDELSVPQHPRTTKLPRRSPEPEVQGEDEDTEPAEAKKTPRRPALPFLDQHGAAWQGEDQKRFDPRSRRPDPRDRSGFVWSLLLFLLLVGLGIAVWWFWPHIREYLGLQAYNRPAPLQEPIARSVQSGPDFELDLVPANAAAFASVRVSELWSTIGKKAPADWRKTAENEIKARTGLDPSEIERIALALLDPPDGGGAGAKPEARWMLAVTSTRPVDVDSLKKTIVPNGVEKAFPSLNQKYWFDDDRKVNLAVLSDKVFVIFTTPALEAMVKQSQSPGMTGPLQAALQATRAKASLAAGWNLAALPEKFRDVSDAGVPPLFEALVPLRRAVDSVVAIVKHEDALNAEVSLRFTEPARAKAGHAAVKKLIDDGIVRAKDKETELARFPEAKVLFTNLRTMLEGIRVELRQSEVRVAARMDESVLIGLAETLRSVPDSSERGVLAMNNLKKIAVAMHEYHDVHKRLPPPVLGKNKNGLSWRVALLPHLGHEDLYRQFNLNEDWDSPANLKLLEKMPAVFAPDPSLKAPRNTTYYQVFAGAKTPFDASVQTFPFADGSSLTMLVAEAAKPVPWTAPRDLPFEPGTVPALGAHVPGNFLAVFGDTTSYLLPRNLDLKLVEAYITPAGGETDIVPPGEVKSKN